jgi:hypothetical protein
MARLLHSDGPPCSPTRSRRASLPSSSTSRELHPIHATRWDLTLLHSASFKHLHSWWIRERGRSGCGSAHLSRRV